MKERQSTKSTPTASSRTITRDVPWYPVACVLAILVLSVYWQVGGHAFINIDDGPYVAENPVVLRGLTLEGVSWAFSTFHAANWHPLTWISHMVDVELFGPSAGWHHRMNALYHLLNTELLFLVLWRMTGGLWPSAFVAALFGVHPLHVESVAWVAERKDVLSTLFWILTMAAYLRYVRRPGVGRYLLVMATFALGLLSKPMLVTLPFVLLLLDYWPLGRLTPSDAAHVQSWRLSVPVLSRLAWEKAPLFLLSAGSCAVTYVAQTRAGAAPLLEHLPLGWRISNAFVSYVIYLGKMAWPSSLAVFYPYPAATDAGAPVWQIGGSLLLLCGLSAIALRQGPRRPYVAAGWLWYVGTLIPVIGLVQVGAQAHADRYTYVPLIGVFIAIAWGVPALLSGRHRRLALGAIAGVSLAALSAAAWVQAGYWRDSVTLLSRAVAVTDGNWLTWNNLGVAYNELGQYEQAIRCLRESLRIRPDQAEALNNLGASSNGLGQYQQAIGHIRKALGIKPDLAEAWNNLGVSYSGIGRDREAIDHFRESLRIRPGYAEAWNNLGVSCHLLGRDQEAIDYFRESLRIRPGYAEAWNNLGVSCHLLGRDQEAIDYFRESLRIRPGYAEAWNNLGVSSSAIGRDREAIGYFRESLRFAPGNAEVLNNLGISYGALGQYETASGCFEEALRIRPDYAAARQNLAAATRVPGPSR